jgi:hypothetical protein
MTLNIKELDNNKDDDGEPHICVVAAQATEMKAPSRQRGKRATTTSATQHAAAIYERPTEMNPCITEAQFQHHRRTEGGEGKSRPVAGGPGCSRHCAAAVVTPRRRRDAEYHNPVTFESNRVKCYPPAAGRDRPDITADQQW